MIFRNVVCGGFVCLGLLGVPFAWGAVTTDAGAPATPVPAMGSSLSPTLGATPPAAARAVPKTGLDTPARAPTDLATKPSDTLQAPIEPLTPLGNNAFQVFVREATGQSLPLFGTSLFDKTPSVYAPAQNIPVTPDYAVGPGDELLIQVWGALDAELRVVVDRNGQISIPRVGTFSVVGIKAAELDGYIRNKIGRLFRNFELNVTLGQLRSIQVYVVGHARQPGTYTVSSLSTLIHGLFASGGPSADGSMRHVQLKRAGKVVTELDLYDFITKGDNQADVRLQAGDVIVIPPAGPRVALAGATSRAAIYELSRTTASLGDLIDVSTGRLAVTTSTLKASLERIDPTRTPSRTVLELVPNAAGLATPLKDGDIVTLYPISSRIENLVVLDHGDNGTPPLRLSWKPGMHLRDLLLRDQLLTDAYWDRLNAGKNIGTPQEYEINWDYATVQRLNEQNLKTEVHAFALDRAVAGDAKDNLELRPGDVVKLYKPGQDTLVAKNAVELTGSIVGGTQRFPWRAGLTVKDLIRNEEWLVDRYNYWQRFADRDVKGQINWDYAMLTRRNEGNLSKEIKTFNLRDALRHANSPDNLSLQVGDIVTLFTDTEMAVPQARRTRLVTLAGEINGAGVYPLQPGETLRQVLQRAGGLTPQAYVFGAEFTREQTRRQQQELLDQAVRQLEMQIDSSISKEMANVPGAGDEQAAQAQVQFSLKRQQQQLARLKTLKANGRIALELPVKAAHLADLPDLPLEDGDRIHIPVRSAFVMTVGAVHNDNALVWRPGRTVEAVLKLAGTTEAADLDNAFLLRADGTVLGKDQSGAWLFASSSGFDNIELMPGDAVVVPEKLDRKTAWTQFMVGLKDWTQILYQMGLGIAAWKTIK